MEPGTIRMFDLTVPCDKYDRNTFQAWCQEHCKRWCFQKEQGAESNYVHFQARISLTCKKRVTTMVKWMVETMPGVHVSPTANATYYNGNEFYVMKGDTRIEGPWSDRDTIDIKNIPRRLRDNPMWHMWQKTVLDRISQEPDDRTVNVIIDPAGNSGKSFLTLWLKARDLAQRIPVQKEGRDIMRMVMNMPKRTTYFIDLPRATSHKDSNSLYSAIEEIKNGYAYDDRYHFKEEMFEPPHIWVFTNTVPDVELLSRSRWRFWTIDNLQLEPLGHLPNYRFRFPRLNILG